MRKATQFSLIGALAIALIVSMTSLASAAKPGRDAGAKMRGNFGTQATGARGSYYAPSTSTGSYESYYRSGSRGTYYAPARRPFLWRIFGR